MQLLTHHRHDVDLRPVWAILTATASVTAAITWAAWWTGINRITRRKP